MKVTAFDALYSQQVTMGGTLLISSDGSNSGTSGGDISGESGDLSVVRLRSSVALSSNLSGSVGDVLTLIQSSPLTAQFATPSNSGGAAFGSNSTFVSETTAVGVSSNSSRADHTHGGIALVTASSSNTLQRGTLNLRAGTNVSFGLTDGDGDGELDTVTVNSAGSAGGGGVSWVKIVDEDGSSFTSWTGDAGGTWGASGGVITQTTVSASWKRAKYNTVLPAGYGWIIEADIATSTGGAGDRRVGIGWGDGTNGNGMSVHAMVGVGIRLDRDSGATVRTITATINASTTYNLRVVGNSFWISIYLDGTLIGSIPLGNQSGWLASAEHLTLFTYNCSATWDNVKCWALSGGAP